MIKAILFDFDGVIAESVDIKTNAFAALFESEGQDVVNRVVDYHLSNTGVSRYEKFKHIYKQIFKRPLNQGEFQTLCDKFSKIVVDEVIKSPYVKGMKEFLENCASKYRCFVLSATPQDEIEKIIERKNIRIFFRAIYGAPIKKSDAVRDILNKEALDPVEVLYIGDSMSDYIAAKENSVNFIARINKNESIFADAENCTKIEDLTNLNEILEAL